MALANRNIEAHDAWKAPSRHNHIVQRGESARCTLRAMHHNADGVVISSPTGSTGYSFSAGGPILDPLSRNIIVTPIAAYLATLRSVVVPGEQSVTCTVVAGEEAVISIDGWIDEPLEPGDRVTVVAAAAPIRFAELDGLAPFWDLVRQKVHLLPR